MRGPPLAVCVYECVPVHPHVQRECTRDLTIRKDRKKREYKNISDIKTTNRRKKTEGQLKEKTGQRGGREQMAHKKSVLLVLAT